MAPVSLVLPPPASSALSEKPPGPPRAAMSASAARRSGADAGDDERARTLDGTRVGREDFEQQVLQQEFAFLNLQPARIHARDIE